MKTLIHFFERTGRGECVVICDDKHLDETIRERADDYKVQYIGTLETVKGDVSMLPMDRELTAE